MNNRLVGNSFEKLTYGEMLDLQGSGDIKPETTPATIATPEIGITSGIAVGYTAMLIVSKITCD